ncbi:HEAT repeat domain-containing protein [Streptomyces mesophilus]|uniref:HEAT repeat domain-containing protein n=1 Tax=Streptomyces mesophilus TaxID=1775132 RepID=UPI0033316287
MSAQEAKARRLARLAAQVDWAKVVDPYSTERYDAQVLDELWSADRDAADEMCTSLYFAAVGDGSSVRAAAAEIVPFLVEAARDPDVTVRCDILQTVAEIAETGNTAPTAEVAPLLKGKWRPTVDPSWPAAWARAARGLLPLLDDEDDLIRAGAVRALAQAAAHADTLIPVLRTRFESEPDLWQAERLVLAVGELARYAIRHREAALAWLRSRTTDQGKGAEPDFDEDIEAWLAWYDEVRHDVRLHAVQALRRALPDHADPRYARATTEALLASAGASAHVPVEHSFTRIDVITAADRRLGADLPGRLGLARALLGHDEAATRAGGLRVAARVISRWRSAVPDLLPAVAGLVDDTDADNRVFALRVLAMCGPAAHPWADRIAAQLTSADEAHAPVREHAGRALSRIGDARCVPLLAELLTAHKGFTVHGGFGAPGGFTYGHPASADRGWNAGDLSLAEALAPFAAHADVLLDPLLACLAASAHQPHAYHTILRRWHQDGGRVIPRLIELLDDEKTLMVAAHALLRMDSGPVAAAHRDRLRRRLKHPETSGYPDLDSISPFDYHALTGDDEPVRALLHSTDHRGFPEPSPELPEPTLLRACVTLGSSLGASAADGLRELFREALSRKPGRWSDAPKGAVERARALWRVTDDPDEVLPGLEELTARSAADAHQTPGGVEALELLAEVAATHPPVAERVARRLAATARERIRHGNCSDAMRTVRSLWRLTADPRQVVQALIDLVGICPPPGSAGATVLDPLHLLAEVAAADPASVTSALPVLHALLEADERPVRHDHWGAVRDDELLCAAVRAVLDATAVRDAATAEDASGAEVASGG